MTNGVLLNSAFRDNLLSLKQTREVIDRTTERLATGRKVNSALDDTQNFFTARELTFRSNDLSRLLDGIGTSIRTIEQAQNGVQAQERLLSQSRAEATELLTNQQGKISNSILADNPTLYYRFNESGTENIVNSGSIGPDVNGTAFGNVSAGDQGIYGGDDGAASFGGNGDGIIIPNDDDINLSAFPNKTIEFTFKANTTDGRQVIYEEGGGITGINIYVNDGTLYFYSTANGTDSDFLSVNIEADTTYHAAFIYSSDDDEIRAYLNGEQVDSTAGFALTEIPAHGNSIGVGFLNRGAHFHDIQPNGAPDGEAGGRFFFDGSISDLALYNSAISDESLSERGNIVENLAAVDPLTDLKKILDQLTQITEDSQYRGLSLLNSQTLETYFNADRTTSLRIEGQDLSASALGLDPDSLSKIQTLDEFIDILDDALETVRNFTESLSNSLNIIKIRQDFIREQIITKTAGADDLTQADLNEEGANLLAAQTREQLGVVSLSLASQSSSSILNLFA